MRKPISFSTRIAPNDFARFTLSDDLREWIDANCIYDAAAMVVASPGGRVCIVSAAFTTAHDEMLFKLRWKGFV